MGDARVSLVGAGPGDPDLLTVRAARLLAAADVVLVDALVDDRVLALCRRDARVVDVGKIGDGPSTAQRDIEDLLVAEARSGRRVVRLKGGDPFVFGRGGEEVEALARAGFACAVVPGLSSALSVPALAGIPLTHRGVATSFTVLTGRPARVDDKDTAALAQNALEDAWRAAAATRGTLVFLMAVHVIERVVEVLLEAGMAPDLPAAILESGAQENQRVTTSTLELLAVTARQERVRAPAVIVVGVVARFAAATSALAATIVVANANARVSASARSEDVSIR